MVEVASSSTVRAFPTIARANTDRRNGFNRQLNALVVDDSAADRKLIEFHLTNLESHSVTVTPAASVTEATEVANLFQFDIVFLDLGLPESNGPETVTKFVDLNPDIPVVVVTGYNDEMTGLDSIARGAQDFISKQNLNVAGVAAAMRHAIERQRLYSQLERLIADTPLPMLIVDYDYTVQFANAAACKLHQCEVDDLLDEHFHMNLIDAEANETKTLEYIIDNARVKNLVVEANVRPTLWAGARAYLVTLYDITHHKEAKNKLAKEKKHAVDELRARDEFLSNISHELKTPLNAIMGFSDLILSESCGPINNDLYKGYIETILDSGEALNCQITDLLELSRLNSREFELLIDQLDMGSVTYKLVQDMLPTANVAGVSLAFHQADAPKPGETSPLHIEGDARKLRIVLRHLVGNAIKFTPPGGNVVISLSKREEELICLISDTGCGIHEDELTRVLEPFERGDKSAKRNLYSGAGVGLTLANKLIGLHGGSLTIESKPNAGTTVILRVPMKQGDNDMFR
jgi:signal transduction histidine kinase